MTAQSILLLNFEEVRRRSIKLWRGIPATAYDWRPDEKAMTMLETVRHVLESEEWFYAIVQNRGSVDFQSPWKDRPYTNVEDELAFAASYREKFLAAVANFTNDELATIEIYRPEKNQRRKLGDYLLRMAYHESVHTGQLLDYLRSAGVERPLVWD